MMKVFRFQQFDIIQDESIFRVGTDAVLLGVLANPKNGKTALEVGTGTGVISLMLAQRFPELHILAVDINEKAVEIAQTNFSASPFSSRLKSRQADFKSFDFTEKVDFVFSNPPYFEANDSSKDVLARQKVELDFEDLIKTSTTILSEYGVLAVIIPVQDKNNFIALCEKEKLHLKRKVSIRGIEGGEVRRVILSFSKSEVDRCIAEEFVVEKSPRQYSDQYLEYTKDFHLFKA